MSYKCIAVHTSRQSLENPFSIAVKKTRGGRVGGKGGQLRNKKLTLELSFLRHLLGSILLVEYNSEVIIDFSQS